MTQRSAKPATSKDLRGQSIAVSVTDVFQGLITIALGSTTALGRGTCGGFSLSFFVLLLYAH